MDPGDMLCPPSRQGCHEELIRRTLDRATQVQQISCPLVYCPLRLLTPGPDSRVLPKMLAYTRPRQEGAPPLQDGQR